MICTEDDEYVRERPRWVATLDDGTRVFADDDRPGVLPPSAWVRLKAYCEQNSARVVGLRAQFRSNVVDLPSGCRGYFAIRTMSGAVAGNTVTYQGIRLGWVDDEGGLQTIHFRAPDLTVMDCERRPVDPECESLILNGESGWEVELRFGLRGDTPDHRGAEAG